MSFRGLLWYDNSTAPFEDKVNRAIEYYQTKYGKCPNVCLVHPSLATIPNVGEVEIKANQYVRPNHFWIGINHERTDL